MPAFSNLINSCQSYTKCCVRVLSLYTLHLGSHYIYSQGNFEFKHFGSFQMPSSVNSACETFELKVSLVSVNQEWTLHILACPSSVTQWSCTSASVVSLSICSRLWALVLEVERWNWPCSREKLVAKWVAISELCDSTRSAQGGIKAGMSWPNMTNTTRYTRDYQDCHLYIGCASINGAMSTAEQQDAIVLLWGAHSTGRCHRNCYGQSLEW